MATRRPVKKTAGGPDRTALAPFLEIPEAYVNAMAVKSEAQVAKLTGEIETRDLRVEP